MCLMCTNGDSTRRGFLAAEGFGSQKCHLEPEPRNQVRLEAAPRCNQASSVPGLACIVQYKIQSFIVALSEIIN